MWKIKALSGSPTSVPSDVDVNEKLRLYDEISGRIGEIILRANAVAEDIVNEARNRSRALLEKTADDISETCKMLMSILDDAKNQLRNKSILDIKEVADTKATSSKKTTLCAHLTILPRITRTAILSDDRRENTLTAHTPRLNTKAACW